MPQLFTVVTPREALDTLSAHVNPIALKEIIPTQEAFQRIAAEDVLCPENLPAFPRSSMDGYAVRAEDTYGASEALPAYFDVVGEVIMGCPPTVRVSHGQAAVIHTGGPLPEGADAVVMIENTQKVSASSIEVVKPVAVGENVIQIGDEAHQGEMLLTAGRRIRAQDIGVLLAVGITQVTVYHRPRVAIISTGDEIVPPEVRPVVGQVRNVNTYTMCALTQQAGAVPITLGIVPDSYEALRAAVEKGLGQADAVVITAGSSVSTRDLTAQVINSIGKPGVLVHGVSLKPGKPSILAAVGNKPVFGLAGNPGSALVTFALFVTPIIHKLSGATESLPWHTVQAKIMRNVASAPGREDYVPVKLVDREGETWAEPILGKSSLLFTLVKADGLACISLNQSGVKAGEVVTVKLLW